MVSIGVGLVIRSCVNSGPASVSDARQYDMALTEGKRRSTAEKVIKGYSDIRHTHYMSQTQ